MLTKVIEHLIQGPCHQCGSLQNDPSNYWKHDELLTLIKMMMMFELFIDAQPQKGIKRLSDYKNTILHNELGWKKTKEIQD